MTRERALANLFFFVRVGGGVKELNEIVYRFFFSLLLNSGM